MKFLKVLKVQTKDFGLQTLHDNLLGTQLYVLDEIEKGLAEGVSTFCILKARQLGLSTLWLAIDLFWAFEHPGLSGCIATHADTNRDQIRAIVDVFLAHLPPSHKVKVSKHNRTMLIFKNGSQFTYLVAGTREKAGKKAGLGRGGAYNFAHRTETANWGSEEDLKELRAAMSTHYKHRLQIDETTARGFNFFHDMYEQAKMSPGMRAIFIGWWRNELYAFDQEDPRFLQYMPKGLKETLTPLERRRVRDVKDSADFEVTHEQVAWYRWKLDDECNGDQAKMDEMFPWTDEDAFQATGAKFFTNAALGMQMKAAKATKLRLYNYVLGAEWKDLGVMETQDRRAGLRVWEPPKPGNEYVIGCDVAYGRSDKGDRHSISIYRCFADRLFQVAEWVSVVASTYHCAWVLAHLAGWYQTTMVNLEMNGPGEAVFNELNSLKVGMSRMPAMPHENDIKGVLNNMRHFLYRRADSLSGGLLFQWKMTEMNKFSMMSAFKDSVDLGRIIIRSMPCLEEMRSIKIEDGVIEAEGAKKDDRAIASGLAHEAWKRWVQPRMLGNGATYKVVLERESQSGPIPPERVAQAMVIDYLRRARIDVTQRQ